MRSGSETKRAKTWYGHDTSGQPHPYPPEIELLQTKGSLRSGSRVFDLGAHQSVIALFLAQIAGPSGHVVAVEASPHNVQAGEKNRDLNGMHNLEILNAAVTDRSGEVSFVALDNGHIAAPGESSGPVIRVRSTTIDDLAHQWGSPDVLFLDIEGFELHALRGARAVLATRPDIFIEVHTGCGLEAAGGSPSRLLKHLPEHRFDLYFNVPGKPDEEAFRPLRRGRLPEERFYLVAIGKRSSPTRWWLRDLLWRIRNPLRL